MMKSFQQYVITCQGGAHRLILDLGHAHYVHVPIVVCEMLEGI